LQKVRHSSLKMYLPKKNYIKFLEYLLRVHLVPSVLSKLKPIYPVYQCSVPRDFNVNSRIVSSTLNYALMYKCRGVKIQMYSACSTAVTNITTSSTNVEHLDFK
jgi:hypothetical protein